MPNDRIDVAGVMKGLSPETRAYFSCRRFGILIGDGQLNYQQEKIFEAYYALCCRQTDSKARHVTASGPNCD
jgi:hypothetical protein